METTSVWGTKIVVFLEQQAWVRDPISGPARVHFWDLISCRPHRGKTIGDPTIRGQKTDPKVAPNGPRNGGQKRSTLSRFWETFGRQFCGCRCCVKSRGWHWRLVHVSWSSKAAFCTYYRAASAGQDSFRVAMGLGDVELEGFQGPDRARFAAHNVLAFRQHVCVFP